MSDNERDTIAVGLDKSAKTFGLFNWKHDTIHKLTSAG